MVKGSPVQVAGRSGNEDSEPARSGLSFVKERGKNWEQKISPEMDVVMGSTRQDRELRWDEMFTIPASIL
jgi:hypothetical protein